MVTELMIFINYYNFTSKKVITQEGINKLLINIQANS